MILLPLPIISAIILGFLALRMALRWVPVPLLALLLALLALQALINALSLHYGLAPARFAQPITALALPATAWLAWQKDGLGRKLSRGDVVHALGPVAAVALRYENSLILELLVPAVYAAYGAALAWSLLRAGPDLPRVKLGQGGAPRAVWGGIAAALVLSALTDLAIAAVIALGHIDAVPRLVDLATSALLLGMGGLALRAQDMTGAETTTARDAATAPPSEDDAALFARLEDLMAQRRLWRDPDITLAALARRLHVPAKALSIAVNRVTGQNISRYVNAKRIAAAGVSLEQGASVTEAMLDAGFTTKSNFNREFRRITGNAPSAWAPQK